MGKTTLAKKLAKRLRISQISSDVLDSISRQYVPKKDIKKQYPYSYLRRQGKARNNDEFYSTYSTNKIVSVLRREAKSTEKAIDAFVACAIDNGKDYIVEGYHLSPAFVKELINKYGKKHIKAVFLTKFDAEKFASDVHKSSTPNDWLLVLTKKEETFLKVGKMVVKYSNFFEVGAKKYRFEVFNMDFNFRKQIQKIIHQLIGT